MTDKPWEEAVTSVSLAGRTEEIADMWRPWKAAVDEGGDLDWLRGQLESLIESVAENWQGTDGAMFQQKANDIGKLINAIQSNYQTMWTCLSTSRAALTDAKRSIPIPVFGGNYINGTPSSNHPDASDPKLDYGLLYHDYQNSTDGTNHYADFKAKAATFLASYAGHNSFVDLHGQGWDNGVTIDTDYSINMFQATHPTRAHAPSDDEIKRVANQAAEDWYNSNAPLASSAMETLRTEYAQQKARLPGPTMAFTRDDTRQPHGPSAQPYDSSAVSGAANSGSAANFNPGSSAAGLQGSSPRNWPSAVAAGHDSVADASTQQPATTGLSGTGHLSGASPASGLGSLGVGGGSGGVGVSGTFGDPWAGSALPGGVANWGGAGVGSGAEPLGPASDPQAFLKAAGNALGQPASGGMGMMGGGSGMGGAVPRDEHHAWLTEDEDIWSIPPDQFPPDLT